MSSSLRRGLGSYFSNGSPAPSAMSASSDSVGQSRVESARIEGGVGLDSNEEDVASSSVGGSNSAAAGTDIESEVGSEGIVDVEGSEGVVVRASDGAGRGRSDEEEGTRWVHDSSADTDDKRTSAEAQARVDPMRRTHLYASCSRAQSSWQSQRIRRRKRRRG